MPNCHSCKTSDEIKQGLYRDTPWEQVPCSTCKHFDKFNSADAQTQIPESRYEEADAAQDLVPIALMQAFVAGILSLPSHLRDVVCYRYQGLSYKNIADIQNISLQAVTKRLKKAIELWPDLKELFLQTDNRS